ncbi:MULTISPECIES: terminase small subunit [unclassified Caballeronia]|uniref:terminase small subunit n=1 Tax=unclassified Caballeronia TaxID=2646786 RepID=UPI0028633D44|nr:MULTISPECIES: terminase small subunit [unclassified Caballeronia]MDR5776273.1 terminase small subunit [Caballeronia sp. LZ002]MDR5851714.1 terminase small subunit [Caballeronia sp. LZ003]
MALTAKKRLFADAVLAGKSNKNAAVAAGYSVKTASAAGSRLVKDVAVVAYLTEHRKKPAARAARTPKAAAATQDDALALQEDARAKADEAVASAALAAGFDLTAMTHFSDPKQFLLAAMNDGRTEPRLRVTAAQVLMPFMHQKLGEGGKKDAKAEAAQKAASKFASLAAPKLIVNNRK